MSEVTKEITNQAAAGRLEQLRIRKEEMELQDLQERLDERQLVRETKIQRSRTNGATLASIAFGQAAAEKRCNHRKGGNGDRAIILGEGDDNQYSVLKHQFANGDIWVRCLRCGKTWKPPLEEDFVVDGEVDEISLLAAEREYKEALTFQTRNQMSGGIQFRFEGKNGEDATKYFRRKVKNTNLR